MYSHLRPAARRLSTQLSQSTRSTFARNFTTYQNRTRISTPTRSKVHLPFLSRHISSSRTSLLQSQQQKMDPSPSGSNATTKADPAPAAPSPAAAPTGSNGSSTSPGAGSTSPSHSSPTGAAESTTTTTTSTSSTTTNPTTTVTDAASDPRGTLSRPTQFAPPLAPEDPLQDFLSVKSQKLSNNNQPLPLPSPESATPIPSENQPKIVTVNGQAVALDNLGPMVVHKDGTISRIANWGEMTDLERQNTLRILGRRNQLRLTNLREGRVNGEGM